MPAPPTVSPAAAADIFFRELADRLPAIIWTLDDQGRCTHVNRHWCEHTGLDMAASLADGWRAALHPESLEAFVGALRGPAAAPVAHRLRLRSAAGFDWVDALATPAASAWLISAEPAAASDAAPLDAPGSPEYFRVCVENLIDCFGVFSAIRDRSGRIVDFRIDYLNAAACRNNGASLDEQVGRGLLERLPAHLETGLFDAYVQLVETGEPIDRVMQFYADDYNGRRQARWFNIRANRLADGFTAAWRDVSDERNAIETLRWGDALFRRLAESNIVGIGVGNTEGDVQFVNDEMLRMMGATRSDFEAGRLNWAGALTQESLAEARASLAELQRRGGTSGYQREFIRPDGGRTPFIGAAATTPIDGVHLSIALDASRLRETERTLRASEDRLRFALQAAAAGVWEWDVQTGSVVWSPENYVLYGLDPASGPVSYALWEERIHPDDRARVNAEIADLLTAQRTRMSTEFRVLHAGGQLRWLLGLGQVDHGADGVARRVSGVNIDITDRKLVELALQDSEKRFRKVFDHAPTGIAIADLEGRIEHANPAYCALLGYPLKELRTQHLGALVHPQDRAENLAQLQRLRAGELAFVTIDHRYLGKGGTQVWVHKFVTLLDDEAGRPSHLLALVSDESERRRAQQAVRRSRDQLQATLNSISDGVLVLDADWRYTYVSDPAARLLGMPARDLLGANVWEKFPQAHGSRFYAAYHQAVSSGQAVHFEEYYPEPLNMWLDCHCYPSDGGLTVYFRDVTERRRAEEQLQRNADTFRTLVQGNPFGLYVVDADFRLREVSLGAQKVFSGVRPLFGRDFAEVLHTLWPEPFASETIALFRHTLETGEPYRSSSAVERRADIDEIESYDWRIERIVLPDGRFGVVCHFYDLSDRQRWEAALRESEERFRSMADSLPLVVWLHDGEGRQEWVNQTFCDFFGVTREEMRDGRWQLLTHPDDGSAYVDAFVAAVRERAHFHGEVRARIAGGQWRWMESWGRPRFSGDGVFLGHVGVSVDVTERKHSEQALHDADRRKDEFLATLAHELRNPLAPIRSAVELLKSGSATGDTALRARDVIDRQTQHLVRLVDDLLDVNRITHGKLELRFERVALATVVEHALETCRPSFARSARTLSVSLPAVSVVLQADPVRLAQVLTNTLYNAHKYSDDGAAVSLVAAAADGWVTITIRDGGIGIAPEYLPRVFDMFSQHPPAFGRSQGGLGIGLALARHLVEAHGGTIEAHSAGLGQGSAFVIRVPAAADTSAYPPHEPASEQPPATGSRKRVLVVDDNVDAADSLAMVLDFEGCDVRVAYDGAQALAAASAFGPELILLDIGLPDISGHEVCRELRASADQRTAVIVALTGWGQDQDRRTSAQAGFDAHLVKPVEVADLRRFLGGSESAPTC